jgi:hypothetical protein
LEAIRQPRRRKTKADVEAAFCRAAGTVQLSAAQREECEALWCRIQALAKTDPYIAALFVSEGGDRCDPSISVSRIWNPQPVRMALVSAAVISDAWKWAKSLERVIAAFAPEDQDLFETLLD